MFKLSLPEALQKKSSGESPFEPLRVNISSWLILVITRIFFELCSKGWIIIFFFFHLSKQYSLRELVFEQTFPSV